MNSFSLECGDRVLCDQIAATCQRKPIVAKLPSIEKRKLKELLKENPPPTGNDELKNFISLRLCGECVSDDWLKFYEIADCIRLEDSLARFSELGSVNETKVFHVCEVPGPSIAALNHYIYSKINSKTDDKRNYTKYVWNASTKLHTRDFPKDKYRIIGRNCEKWAMRGAAYYNQPEQFDLEAHLQLYPATEYECDMEYEEHVEQVVDFVSRNLSKVHICVGDIGNKSVREIIGQTITLLSVLECGGMIIMKTYTADTKINKSLLAFISSKFSGGVKFVQTSMCDKIRGESYLICDGYIGISEEDGEILKRFLRRKISGPNQMNTISLDNHTIAFPIDSSSELPGYGEGDLTIEYIESMEHAYSSMNSNAHKELVKRKEKKGKEKGKEKKRGAFNQQTEEPGFTTWLNKHAVKILPADFRTIN